MAGSNPLEGYTKIDDNTYERYNPKTKMKIILKFAETNEHDQEIHDFIIKTLSELYLKRIFKEHELQ